ncbi:MAG: response regulator [Nitrospirae bacterium]|nr:response regulator [Nitrospirota bacterium]
MATVLVVDDMLYAREASAKILQDAEYDVYSCKNADEALTSINNIRFDAVLSDIKMPGLSGIDFLERSQVLCPDLPVILMTGYAELDAAINAVKKGAFDFITKPYDPDYLVHSVKKAIDHKKFKDLEKNYRNLLEEEIKSKTRELSSSLSKLKDLNREMIYRLTFVAEHRDTDTGAHISRMGLYANKLAEQLEMPADFVDMITLSSPMHDIGKVAIPDNILLKQGALTAEEFDIIKTHTTIGAKMMSASSHKCVQMSESVALYHHERWDGTGYPNRLKGTDIPMEGRIVMICDQYDALRSDRPYKKGFTHDETLSILTKGDGRTMPHHFDPDVLNAFTQIEPLFDELFTKNSG